MRRLRIDLLAQKGKLAEAKTKITDLLEDPSRGDSDWDMGIDLSHLAVIQLRSGNRRAASDSFAKGPSVRNRESIIN